MLPLLFTISGIITLHNWWKSEDFGLDNQYEATQSNSKCSIYSKAEIRNFEFAILKSKFTIFKIFYCVKVSWHENFVAF